MTAYILNLIDCAFTLYALDMGAKELNPFMQNVSIMIFWKVFVVLFLLEVISDRPERIARYGLFAITAVYAAVDLWHIVNIAAIMAA